MLNNIVNCYYGYQKFLSVIKIKSVELFHAILKILLLSSCNLLWKLERLSCYFSWWFGIRKLILLFLIVFYFLNEGVCFSENFVESSLWKCFSGNGVKKRKKKKTRFAFLTKKKKKLGRLSETKNGTQSIFNTKANDENWRTKLLKLTLCLYINFICLYEQFYTYENILGAFVCKFVKELEITPSYRI